MYNYNALTNEIVLDRSKTKRTGALLISNGCDLLLSEYWILKENNIPFKCINRGLYREKKGYTNYTKEEYEEFIKKIEIMPEQTKKINPEFLKSYYEEVVLKMNYSQEIVEIIKRELSKYVELDIKKNTK